MRIRFGTAPGTVLTLARNGGRFQAFPVNEMLNELAAALTERLRIIGDDESRRLPEQHMARLQKVSEQLEEMERRLPAGTDPQLRHFLQRRSYSKALEYITANSSTS